MGGNAILKLNFTGSNALDSKLRKHGIITVWSKGQYLQGDGVDRDILVGRVPRCHTNH